jgi:hypothetical protein
MINRNSLGWGEVRSAKANTDMGMVVHYDGSNQRLASQDCTACEKYWVKTRKMHMQGNGWIDIGYAFGVCPHGNVYEGRGYGRVQAAAAQTPGKLPNGNTRWVNVTFMSGPNEMPTPQQIMAFRELRAQLMDKGMKGEVKGHRDFTATSCPGDILYRFVKEGEFKESSSVTPKEFWNYEIPIKLPWASKDNPTWQADSLLVEANKRIRTLEEKVDDLSEKIDALIRLAS